MSETTHGRHSTEAALARFPYPIVAFSESRQFLRCTFTDVPVFLTHPRHWLIPARKANHMVSRLVTASRCHFDVDDITPSPPYTRLSQEVV